MWPCACRFLLLRRDWRCIKELLWQNHQEVPVCPWQRLPWAWTHPTIMELQLRMGELDWIRWWPVTRYSLQDRVVGLDGTCAPYHQPGALVQPWEPSMVILNVMEQTLKLFRLGSITILNIVHSLMLLREITSLAN